MSAILNDLYEGKGHISLVRIEDGKEFELSSVTTCESLTQEEAQKTPFGWAFPLEFSMTFKVKRKTALQIRKALGLAKKRRTTYKTIKRDCAKRNRI